MNFEPPLRELFARCLTVCEPECCGLDAYDISPIHIASFLIMKRGEPDPAEVGSIRAQLEAFDANYGRDGASNRGVVLDEMNQRLSGDQVSSLVSQLEANLEVALRLVAQTSEGEA